MTRVEHEKKKLDDGISDGDAAVEAKKDSYIKIVTSHQVVLQYDKDQWYILSKETKLASVQSHCKYK